MSEKDKSRFRPFSCPLPYVVKDVLAKDQWYCTSAALKSRSYDIKSFIYWIYHSEITTILSFLPSIVSQLSLSKCKEWLLQAEQLLRETFSKTIMQSIFKKQAAVTIPNWDKVKEREEVVNISPVLSINSYFILSLTEVLLFSFFLFYLVFHFWLDISISQNCL